MPELSSHSSCSKKVWWEKATCTKFILCHEFTCRKLVRNGYASTTWPRHCKECWKALVGFLQASFSAHSYLPWPQAPYSQPRQKNFPRNQTEGRPPLAPKWWTNCFGHPEWASNPLNNPGLKHRGLIFWPWVWLFYFKPSLEMQAVHYCHREVLLKKKDMWKTVFILGKTVRKDFDQKANLFMVWLYLFRKLKGRRPTSNSSAVQTMETIVWSLKSQTKRREQIADWNVWGGERGKRGKKVYSTSFL